MRQRRIPWKIFTCTMWGLLFTHQAWSDGLRMNYAEVAVQNLQIGQKVDLTDLTSFPLEITSRFETPIKLQIRVLQPEKSETKPGYEPIPDPAWVSVGLEKAELVPRGTFKTNILVAIPKNKKYLGKKYHVNLNVRVLPDASGSLIHLAIQGRLLLTIAPVVQVAPETPRKANLNFEFLPARIECSNLPLGRPVSITTTGKGVGLVNHSDKPLHLGLSSLAPKDTVLSLEPGYTGCPEPKWLSFREPSLEIGAQTSRQVEVVLEIPDQPKYRGQRYQFIVAAATGDGMSGVRYLPVLVSTEK